MQNEQQLIIEHMSLVKRIARQIHRPMRGYVPLDDLVQDGMLGLIEAAGRFDEAAGAPFEAYARMRIRGAILDGMRRASPSTRRANSLKRKVAVAMTQIQHQTMAPATAQATAEHLDIDVSEVYGALALAEADILDYDEHGEGEAAVVETNERPDLAAETQSQIDTLFACVRSMPRRERMVFFQYFMEGRTLADIGRRMGYGKTNIELIKNAILQRIRGAMPEHAARVH